VDNLSYADAQSERQTLSSAEAEDIAASFRLKLRGDRIRLRLQEPRAVAFEGFQMFYRPL
jgi:hypothetical protein